MKREHSEDTRRQIVNAALIAITEAGFDGISTRQIAARANVSQGLLTYHFKSKDALWHAAADHMFELANIEFEKALSSAKTKNPRDIQRTLIRQMVYFNAEHPELMHFMIENGKEDTERSRWLVDTHCRPFYEKFTSLMSDIPDIDLPHAFYVLVGASGLIFCAANECRQLTGKDPTSKAAIKRHAEYCANLLIPDEHHS